MENPAGAGPHSHVLQQRYCSNLSPLSVAAGSGFPLPIIAPKYVHHCCRSLGCSGFRGDAAEREKEPQPGAAPVPGCAAAGPRAGRSAPEKALHGNSIKRTPDLSECGEKCKRVSAEA
ncbi:uncharacterized protein WM277_015287 [Molossus nigricans]